MMYLSKVRVDWDHARNAYSLHKALWTLFPDQPREARKAREEERQGFLFRVEQRRTGYAALALLQSRVAPQKTADGVRLEYAPKTFEPTLSKAQTLRFRLTANPVKTIKDENGRKNTNGEIKTCRVPLLKEEEQAQWLIRHLEPATEMIVNALVCRPELPVYFRKGDDHAKIKPVTFDGVLTVKDPDALWTLIRNGIGPAKGLGCGLLSVARA
jgi:CRISPR system Cascade subunit CasE